MITGIICLIGFCIGSVYVTPGGQAVLSLVDYFGGGFIIFLIAIIEVIGVRLAILIKYIFEQNEILQVGSTD